VYSEYLLKDGHFSLRSPALGGELDTNKILGMQNAEEIKGLGETAVSTLINVLQDKNTLFWKWCLAAKTLGEMGPIALKASSALDKMGAPKAEDIHTLINFLKHENEYIRVGAANALGKMGPLASQAIPALKHALKSVKYDEPEVKYAITEALERVEEKR